ncbi:DnaJ subfamily C member 8 [Candidozyma auris]|uniref:J domain-containing protein n=2 Tax=Candidozyma auris TaxID=498019 RepID=A0A2H0ZTH6_CANAR|nr:hypothetical_protein [[Candida] auris]KND96083.2 hypothetical protein QG37_07568 [[Candida] auris]PIS51901.1 hypothetical protein B9J08_003507 [[Candida] auris]PIS53888.1 hypothetical protein CJI97_003581 [[Candida] auris]QEO21128.1 hypothetical_protein [[Candida] auris]QWW21771.1 hypothetical protein CA7LBN_000517 [[Candida] auris]
MALEDVLRAQESEAAREAEVQRILNCAAGDYFAILEINPLFDRSSLQSRVTKWYRKKSLLIHPDKTKHEDAPKAFDLLKKAESVLSADNSDDSEEGKKKASERNALQEIYETIANNLDVDVVEDFNSRQNIVIREKVAQTLEHQAKAMEVERLYQQREDVHRSEEVKNAAKDRELRKKWEARWEEDRDSRVESWRKYKVGKPKKKKAAKTKKVLV